MTALIALQFKVIWRGLPGYLRGVWVFLLMAGCYAATKILTKSGVSDDGLAALAAGPLVIVLIGVATAASTAELLTWLVPVPRKTRVWARTALFALTGIVTTFLLLVALNIAAVPPRVPWIQLAASLWICWIGGGLFLMFLGDLSDRRHPAINAISLVVGIAPAVGMSCYHLTERTPWEVLPAEAVVCVVLCLLTLVINKGDEMTKGAPMSSSEGPDPAAPLRGLDRRPAVVPLLVGGLLRYRAIWTIGVLWLLLSLMPGLAVQAIFGLMFMTLAFATVMNHWRPFQAVPLSRPRVFLMLTGTVLALAAAMHLVQEISFQFWERPGLILDMPGEERGTIGLRIPEPRRIPDEDLSPELRRRSAVKLPASAERTAALTSELYKVAYGIDVPAQEILSMRDPDPRAWMTSVERRWSGAVSRKFLVWRLLLAAVVLACSLVSMFSTLPGRCPAWLHHSLVGGFLLVPMLLIVIHTLELNVLSNHLPRVLRPAYVALFDRPGAVAAVFALLSAALFVRHLRVFSSGELADPARRT